jgi:hypothetical protein
LSFGYDFYFSAGAIPPKLEQGRLSLSLFLLPAIKKNKINSRHMDSRLSCGYVCSMWRERMRENERPKEGKAPTHFELLQRNNSGRAALTFPRKGNLTLLA